MVLVLLYFIREARQFGRDCLELLGRRRPTVRERNDNLNWIADFIQRHPNDTIELQLQYPECARRAFAALQYEHINDLLERGVIDDIRYAELVDEVAAAIDIAEDIRN